jgi:LysR family hca operon transcriptional activator
MLLDGLSDRTRIDLDAGSLAHLTRRAAEHRRDDLESVLASAWGRPFERKNRCGFLRRERGVPELAFRSLVKEPLVVILPSDHRLAELEAISPRDLAGETFVAVSDTAPVLRVVIDNYLKRSRINVTPAHEADHLAMGMSKNLTGVEKMMSYFSLIVSTRGVGMLPAYAQKFLPSSVTSRPLKGDAPTIDLVLGYKKSNQSPVL